MSSKTLGDIKLSEVSQLVADRARAQLIHMRSTKAFKEAVQERIIEMGRADTALLEPQRRVVEDTSRYITLCCSRRAGKSELMARLIAATLLEAAHNEWIVFGARTLGIAKDIIWADLEAINERYSLGWNINNSDLSITTDKGGRFRLFGVDDRKSVEKVRGKKYRLVICDEASTYQEHLQQLIEQAFLAGTVDLRGRVVLAGTPGYVKAGYWYKASQGQLDGWSNHHWTLFDNTYIHDVAAELDAIRAKFGWDKDHPTYVCEYLGIWADNSTMLVVDYSDARNAVHELPKHYSKTWRHVIAVDYGYNDAAAWKVIAVDPHSDDRYVVKYIAKAGLIGDEPVDIMRDLVEEFETTYAVSDPSGGGKTFYETFNAKHGRRMGCIVRSANKTDLLGSIRLVNAELRTGRLKFYLPEAAEAVNELRPLLWKDELKEKIIDTPPFKVEALDTLRYGLLETISWQAADKPPEVDPEWAAAEQARRERAKRAEKKSAASWFDRR
jgi:hypothetical protein